MTQKLAWWLSFAETHAACVVETGPDADVLDAVVLARARGCAGDGEVRATFVAATTMERDIPRRLWYRLRTLSEWRSCGVDVETEAVPPGFECCPWCKATPGPT
jgi:hypothetical protein